MKKTYGAIFVVINGEDVVFASEEYEKARTYAEKQNYAGRKRAMNELGLDEDASVDEVGLAEYQLGYDGDLFTVERCDLTGLTLDDEAELEDGSVLDVRDIVSALS